MILVIKSDAFSLVGGGVKGGLLVELWGGVTCAYGCTLMIDKCSWSRDSKPLASVDLLLEDDAFANHNRGADVVDMIT